MGGLFSEEKKKKKKPFSLLQPTDSTSRSPAAPPPLATRVRPSAASVEPEGAGAAFTT